MTYTRKAIRGAIIVFVMSTFSSLFAYLLRLVLARNLTPVEYGMIYSIFALFGLLSVLQHMGLNDALIKYIAEFNIKKKYVHIKSAIILVLSFQFMTAAILGILGLVFAEFLANNYFHIPEAEFLLKLFSISIFLSPLDTIFASVFLGFQRMELFSLVNFLRMGFIFVSTYIMLKIGLGIVSPILAYIIVYVFPLVLYYPLLTRKVFPQFLKFKFEFDKPLFRKLLAFGLPIIFTSVAGLVITYTDTIMITYFRGLQETALYNASLPTARVLWMLSEALMIVLFPLSTELWLKNRKYLKEGVELIYKYALILILPAAFALIAFPDLMLRLFFGAAYEPAALSLRILAIGAVILTLANINSTVISGIGRPKINSKIILIAAIANFVGNLILIPRIGYLGATISTVFSFLIILGLNIRKLGELVRVKAPFASWTKTIISSLIFLGTIFYLKRILVMNVIPEAIISLAISILIYLLCIFLTRTVTITEIKTIIGRVRAQASS